MLATLEPQPRCLVETGRAPACRLTRKYCVACNTNRTCLPNPGREISCRAKDRRCKPGLLHYDMAKFSQTGGVVALSINYPEASKPSLYGHIWYTISNFFHVVVQPRLKAVAANSPGMPMLSTINLVLPSPDISLGVHTDRLDKWFLSKSTRYFEEIQAIFSNDVTGLNITRAPWVPYCHRGCCWQYRVPSTPPDERIMLIHNYPDYFSYKHLPQDWEEQLRDAVVSMLRVRRSPRLITWVLSSSGSNGRRIYDELGLIAHVRQRLPPTWTLRTLDLTNATYGDEVRQISSSAVLVSLFGSALHNCRFMLPNSTIVEVHGALKHDFDERTDFMYQRIARPLGIRWAGFLPDGFRPTHQRIDNVERLKWRTVNGLSARSIAFVDQARFASFFVRVLGAHVAANFSALTKEYRAHAWAYPDPRGRRARGLPPKVPLEVLQRADDA